MRILFLVLCWMMAAAPTARSSQDATIWPQSITLDFPEGYQVVLKTRGVDEVSALTVRDGSKTAPVPEGVCFRLRGVRLETICVSWWGQEWRTVPGISGFGARWDPSVSARSVSFLNFTCTFREADTRVERSGGKRER